MVNGAVNAVIRDRAPISKGPEKRAQSLITGGQVFIFSVLHGAETIV